MKPTLLSVKEVAQKLGVSVPSIRRAYWKGTSRVSDLQNVAIRSGKSPRDLLSERSTGNCARQSTRAPGGAHSYNATVGKTGHSWFSCLHRTYTETGQKGGTCKGLIFSGPCRDWTCGPLIKRATVDTKKPQINSCGPLVRDPEHRLRLTTIRTF